MNAQLRPGADASRAEAELAAARTQSSRRSRPPMWRAPRSPSSSAWSPRRSPWTPGGLLRLPPEQDVPPLDPAKNPDRARAERRGRGDPGAVAGTGALLLSRASTCRARRTRAAPARRSTEDPRRAQRPRAQRRKTTPSDSPSLSRCPTCRPFAPARPRKPPPYARSRPGPSKSPPTCEPNGIAPWRR